MEKETQQKVHYTDKGTNEEHCGNCEYFVPLESCKKVESPIIWTGWCKLWEEK